MATSGISGQNGDIKIGTTSINEIKEWSLNPKANTNRYASNATGGYKATIAGTREGTGTMSGVFTPTASHVTVIDVGTNVTLKLYLNATLFYSVPSVITDYKISVNIDTGETIGWEANFETNGAWANPASSMMMPQGFLDGSRMVQPEQFSGMEQMVQQNTQDNLAKASSEEMRKTIEQVVAEQLAKIDFLKALAAAGGIYEASKAREEVQPVKIAEVPVSLNTSSS